jgi:hypothetical protein
MPNLRISLEGRPLLDIASFARRGPGHRDRLSAAEIAHIGRTVQRTPEVMVKVLLKDSNNQRSVARHLNYIGRRGELELETDDGGRLQSRDAGQQLVQDWDLDLDQDRRELPLTSGAGRAPKLVHKIMLSMPPGTPAKGVLEAARNFAREEFALKHRYTLVLHTNEAHPHVHLVLKAVSEQGERLNIRKATLREWRREFARHLRDQGIAANATERAVRGETRTHKKDGIYRAMLRGDSTHTRVRSEGIATRLPKGQLHLQPGKARLVSTRMELTRGWRAVGDALVRAGQGGLARQTRHFIGGMPPPLTEEELIAASLARRARESPARSR